MINGVVIVKLGDKKELNFILNKRQNLLKIKRLV